MIDRIGRYNNQDIEIIRKDQTIAKIKEINETPAATKLPRNGTTSAITDIG